jgi:hypothetical protein
MPSFDSVLSYAESLTPETKKAARTRMKQQLRQERQLNRRSRAFRDRVEADRAFFARYGIKL